MLTLRSFSGRRFRVVGPVPSPYQDDFHARLTDRRFLPLSAHEEATFGWVTADNLLLTDFDVDTVMRGEHAAFALRIDRRRVNARMLRAQIDLEWRGRRKAAEDMGKPFRMSRDERRQLRDDLKEVLLRETNPTVTVCTVLFHPKRKILHVLSTTRSTCDLVSRLFRDSFAVDLLALTPWRRGGEILAGTDVADSLPTLERTDFAGSHRGVALADTAPAPATVEAPR